MGLFVKVCGIASVADARAVAALEPDAMGFVLWAGSPRGVRVDQMSQWAWTAPPSVKRVGVFVDASADEIRDAQRQLGLHVIQLHGRDDVGRNDFPGAELWRVLHLEKGLPKNWQSIDVDAFLLDGCSAAMPGGTGQVIDWKRAAEVVQESPVPVLLAGGLDSSNVREAVRQVQPFGVDASSRLESCPGKKDINQVKAYIRQCRNA